MPAVNFAHDGEQIRIEVAILPPLDAPEPWRFIKAVGLIDTGAVSTGIARDMAAELRLPRWGKTVIATPSGEHVAQRFQFRLGLFPEASHGGSADLPLVLDRELLGISVSTGQSFSVLIGMDVIGRGDLSISRSGSGSFHFG